MRTTLSATLTAVTLCATPISARIYGIAAPAQLGAGDTVALKILTQNYIQAEQDVAMAFGLQPGNSSYPSSLGLLLGETFIGPGTSRLHVTSLLDDEDNANMRVSSKQQHCTKHNIQCHNPRNNRIWPYRSQRRSAGTRRCAQQPNCSVLLGQRDSR